MSLAASGVQRAIARDLLEAQRDGGPCLDSYGSGRPVPPVSIRAARAAARWPGFTQRAPAHDIAATFAVPLLRHQQPLGALNVFVRALPDGSRRDEGTALRLAQLIADCAALGLENHTAYVQCRTLAGQLQHALSSRVRVEQAKGMLAERWNTAADHAFVALRRYARRRRVPLDQVAGEVVYRVADDAELRREAERADDEGRAQYRVVPPRTSSRPRPSSVLQSFPDDPSPGRTIPTPVITRPPAPVAGLLPQPVRARSRTSPVDGFGGSGPSTGPGTRR